jgi:hypothetical protein
MMRYSNSVRSAFSVAVQRFDFFQLLSPPTMACSRFCSLILRLHVYFFFLIVTCQFLVGLYTEFVLDRISRFVLGWVLRDVIGWHKYVGNALAIAAGIMLLQKLWLVLAKVSKDRNNSEQHCICAPCNRYAVLLLVSVPASPPRPPSILLHRFPRPESLVGARSALPRSIPYDCHGWRCSEIAGSTARTGVCMAL